MSTILIVSGEEDARTRIRLILEAEGHDAIEAGSSEKAESLFDLQPDAILVDVDMEQMAGAQLVMRLRQHATLGKTPLTLLAEHPERINMHFASGVDSATVVAKPFGRKDIHDALARMLRAAKAPSVRVSLHPGDLGIIVDSHFDATVVRLSEKEIYVRGGPELDVGSFHDVTLLAGRARIGCATRVTSIVRGEMRLAVMENAETQTAIAVLISHLLADATAHESVRGAERLPLSASVSWERKGKRDAGSLRDLSVSGCYIASKVSPALGESVRVYLPWISKQGASATLELRGAEAKVVRHAEDGFACMFTEDDPDFFLAVNALMSTD